MHFAFLGEEFEEFHPFLGDGPEGLHPFLCVAFVAFAPHDMTKPHILSAFNMNNPNIFTAPA